MKMIVLQVDQIFINNSGIDTCAAVERGASGAVMAGMGGGLKGVGCNGNAGKRCCKQAQGSVGAHPIRLRPGHRCERLEPLPLSWQFHGIQRGGSPAGSVPFESHDNSKKLVGLSNKGYFYKIPITFEVCYATERRVSFAFESHKNEQNQAP